MPTPFGSDRAITRPDGEIVLLSATNKGWMTRKGRGSSEGDHPGAAVDWEGAVYEVVSAETESSGRVRYHLRPWSEGRMIRAFEPYDEQSEVVRAEHALTVQTRHRRSWLVALSLPLLGHLPGRVQEEFESEYGYRAVTMTMLSAIPTFLFAAWTAVHAPIQGLPHSEPLPFVFYLLGAYWMTESVVRFRFALTGVGCGSAAGVLLYWIWTRLRGGRKETPASARSLSSRSVADVPAELTERDAYHIREHLLALLPPADQTLLAERYGFDPIRWGRITAGALLAVSLLAIVVTLAHVARGRADFPEILATAVAFFIGIEQLVRLVRISRGVPAGSVLGWIIRPFCEKLLLPQQPGGTVE